RHVRGGKDVQMQVLDFEARDEHPRAGGPEGAADRLADVLRHLVAVQEQRRVDILPVVDLRAWDDEGMPLRDGGDGQEPDDGLVRPHEAAGQFAGDDLAENRCHAPEHRRKGPFSPRSPPGSPPRSPLKIPPGTRPVPSPAPRPGTSPAAAYPSSAPA